MIIVGQRFLDVLDGGVLAPAELVGKRLPVILPVGLRPIQLVVGTHAGIVHGNLIVVRQRAARRVIRRLRQRRWQRGEILKEAGLGVVFLRITTGDELARPLRRRFGFRSLPQRRIQREGVGGQVKGRQSRVGGSGGVLRRSYERHGGIIDHGLSVR